MANVKLLFSGTGESETSGHTLQSYCNHRGELFISIDTECFPESFICLDKSTAIKLSKEIRKQIALMEE